MIPLATLTVSPVANQSTHRFDLEGTPPHNIATNSESITWGIIVRDWHDSRERKLLPFSLQNVIGKAEVFVGEDSVSGKTNYFAKAGEREPCHGIVRVSFRSSTDDVNLLEPDQVLIGLSVSEPIFDRLIRLTYAGHLPELIIESSRRDFSAGLNEDMKIGKKGSSSTPILQIEWCSFKCEMKPGA